MTDRCEQFEGTCAHAHTHTRTHARTHTHTYTHTCISAHKAHTVASSQRKRLCQLFSIACDASTITCPSCLHLFLRTFQQPNPFCCNRSTTNLFMISFFSRTIHFFFFFLRLWIYLWLAETSQQPISQTTWLKVTPHCNHTNTQGLYTIFIAGKPPNTQLRMV